MTQHDVAFTMPRDLFDDAVRFLDQAFADKCAAIDYDARMSGYNIFVFDFEAVSYESESDSDYLDTVYNSMSQLLIFAVEDAPREVIEEWANEHEADSGAQAYSRVEFFRANAPNVAGEWRARRLAASPVLGAVDGDVLINISNPEVPQMFVRLDAFIPSGNPSRSPISSSRKFFTVAVTANDLAKLSHIFSEYSHTLEELTASTSADEESGDPA